MLIQKIQIDGTNVSGIQVFEMMVCNVLKVICEEKK